MEAGVDAGGRGPGARGREIGLWLVLGLVLVMRAPFFGGAVQGDDHIYLSTATHALIEPLHPNNTKYVFRGDVVDLRGQTHPPLDGWVLAGLIAALRRCERSPVSRGVHGVLADRRGVDVVFGEADSRRILYGPRCCSWRCRRSWSTATRSKRTCRFSRSGCWQSRSSYPDRLWGAGIAMVLATLTAYQAILLCPILAVYLWLNPGNRRRWLVLLVPPVTIVAYQIFERLSTGAMPASVLTGYLTFYETLQAKLQNALMLFIHSWFIVFPALLPPALVLAWRKRNEPDTRFLLAWIAIFFVSVVALAFAGSARYLLPMAAPVALLASHLRPKWLAPDSPCRWR